MIGKITGVLLEKHPPLVLIDVQGIGYEIDVPMSTFYHLPAIGEAVTLYTQFIVRDDAHLLYGFGTEAERFVFRQLMKISGIGARTALALLSGLSVSDIHHAVATQDAVRFIKIPGIGKKTAERLLLELRDKLDFDTNHLDVAAASARSDSDIFNALRSLGYNGQEVDWAVKQLPQNITVSDGIKQALKLLSKEK